MAISKASKPGTPFAHKASGAGPSQLAVVTDTKRPWKLKEFLLERSTTGALTVNLIHRNVKTGKEYLLSTVAGATTLTVRVAATTTTGEFLFDADGELKVTTTGLGAAETWSLEAHGVVNGDVK
jgi:hypothetical protein